MGLRTPSAAVSVRLVIQRLMAQNSGSDSAQRYPALNRVSIQYIAGLFDGEGCVIIAKTGRGCGTHQVRCTLGVSHEGIIREITNMFGGYIMRRSPRQDGYHTLWYWEVTSGLAVRFLHSMLPHLVIKRSQANMALEFHYNCIDPRSPKVKLLKELRKRQSPSGRSLTTDELKTREEYRLALQKEKRPKIPSS